MTLPLDEDSRPPYLQAAAALRDAILNGEYRSGERLPSANVLGDRFGVSSSTVQNALRVLKQEGLVYSQLGRGSYVSDSVGGSTEEADGDHEETDAEGPDWPVDVIYNGDPRPPYAQVADILRREILEGTYTQAPSFLPPGRSKSGSKSPTPPRRTPIGASSRTGWHTRSRGAVFSCARNRSRASTTGRSRTTCCAMKSPARRVPPPSSSPTSTTRSCWRGKRS